MLSIDDPRAALDFDVALALRRNAAEGEAIADHAGSNGATALTWLMSVLLVKL